MRRRDHIVQTGTLLLGLIALSALCIRHGSWGYSVLISFAIVMLYVFLMEISWRASAALKTLPYTAAPNCRILITLALKIALPLYLCLFCVACIPLFRWELWLLTGFPILLLLSAPLCSIMEELRDRRFPRRRFIAIQLPLLSLIYLLGQLVAWGFVRLLKIT